MRRAVACLLRHSSRDPTEAAQIAEAGGFAVIGAKADAAVEWEVVIIVIDGEGALLLGYRAGATTRILAWPGRERDVDRSGTRAIIVLVTGNIVDAIFFRCAARAFTTRL